MTTENKRTFTIKTMNIKDAMLDFLSNSDFSQQDIDRQMGLRIKTTSEIVNGASIPMGIRLVKVQEFLTRKGYILDELKGLPEYLTQFRSMIFDGRIVYNDSFLKKINLTKNTTFYHFLKTGNLNQQSLDLFLKALKEASDDGSVHAEMTVVKENTSSKKNENLLRHLKYALSVIVTEGAEFLEKSTQVERVTLRADLDPKIIFAATNILSGLSSEKARELQTRKHI